ncbi:MAG: hypothetical protein WAN35_06840 [Terracidiphilus sp.]
MMKSPGLSAIPDGHNSKNLLLLVMDGSLVSFSLQGKRLLMLYARLELSIFGKDALSVKPL